MIVLGIDPAKVRVGWAAGERSGGGREVLLGAGALETPGYAEIAAFAARWAPRASLVVIEDQYLAKGLAMNPETTKAIIGNARQWAQAFGERGVPVSFCMATTWQAELLRGLLPSKGRPDRAARKRASAQFALLTFGVAVKQDEADAIGLMIWGLRRARLAA